MRMTFWLTWLQKLSKSPRSRPFLQLNSTMKSFFFMTIGGLWIFAIPTPTSKSISCGRSCLVCIEQAIDIEGTKTCSEGAVMDDVIEGGSNSPTELELESGILRFCRRRALRDHVSCWAKTKKSNLGSSSGSLGSFCRVVFWDRIWMLSIEDKTPESASCNASSEVQETGCSIVLWGGRHFERAGFWFGMREMVWERKLVIVWTPEATLNGGGNLRLVTVHRRTTNQRPSGGFVPGWTR